MTKAELDDIKEELCLYMHKDSTYVPPCGDQIDLCIRKIRICDVMKILNMHEDEEVNDI